MSHSTINNDRQTIEFWFDFGSNYSYLTAMRIEDLAGSIGVDIVWKPFLLGPIFQSFGWESSPFVLQKQKGEYTWKDMERQAHKHGIAWKKPSTFLAEPFFRLGSPYSDGMKNGLEPLFGQRWRATLLKTKISIQKTQCEKCLPLST